MLAQGMGNLVAEYSRKLRIGEIQFLYEPTVYHDLAARHGVRVPVIGLQRVDFPLPAGSVTSEHRGHGNQTLGDVAHASSQSRVRVELAGLARFLQLLRVGLFSTRGDILVGNEHALFAVNADSTGLGGLDRRTGSGSA